MLQYLKIANLALLEEVVLEFDPGFIAVTGETGAGKSVLLGALSLLSGSRADKNLIRKGADALDVEAIIHFKDSGKIDRKLEYLGLPLTEDGSLILKRSVPQDKAAKIHINGTLATLATLQELGESWIDFHGPGEPQKLFAESWQLALLDLYATHEKDLKTYQTIYNEWTTLRHQLHELRQNEELSEDEQEFIASQIALIDEANLSVERIDTMEQSYSRMSQSQELIELANRLIAGVNDDDGLTDRLQQLIATAHDVAQIDPQSQSLSDRLDSALIEIQDIAEGFSDLLDAVEFEPEEVKAMEAEMDRWIELKRKYGADINAILHKRDQFKKRLQSQTDIEGQVLKIEQQIKAKESSLAQAADTLRLNRIKAAKSLAAEAEKRLVKLGFKKADLKIEIIRSDKFTTTGNTSCQFLFSPNLGQELMPLNKIASSGELARVMLALKTVLAEVDQTPVLVFDEVDSNIGGEIASIVGKDLARLGQHHQVFCITHLAQVASSASSHFVVEKEQSNQATTILISAIHESKTKRLDELARMIGDRKSTSAKSHATELLAQNGYE